MTWNFDNSYQRELEGFYAPWRLDPSPEPKLLLFNEALATQLGLDHGEPWQPTAAEVFSGSALPAGAAPIALAYAGHQFGHFSPQLGDGRALLLGEIITPDGQRVDIQLKGSGRTPFSRNGDGRSALGPALREYLVSEAMYALGVPTTRSLAVAFTGARVVRQRPLPGAVLTRVARSHLRVGTFEFFAAHFGEQHVRKLADYAIARHYPQAASATNPYYALLEAVMNAQINLVAAWMHLGFIHGVMNTDNVAISGETLDYGPCAFMDVYDPNTHFSSIDSRGRYAYGNQPNICQWNMEQLALALSETIAGISAADVEKTQALLDTFPERYQAAWLTGLRAKLGLRTSEPEDHDLAQKLFAAMNRQQVDFTDFFRQLSKVPIQGPQRVTGLFKDAAPISLWLDAWQARLQREPLPLNERLQGMDRVNPIYIPRNHQVEEALAAAEAGDMQPYNALLEVVTHPFEEHEGWDDYAKGAPESAGPYVTYCGT